MDIKVPNMRITYPFGSSSNDIKACRIIANKILELLKQDNISLVTPIDVICRGSSGAIMAAIVVNTIYDYNCRIVHIKKHGESSHAVNCIKSDSLKIIVDDFISTGETFRNIRHAIQCDEVYCVATAGYFHSAYYIFESTHCIYTTNEYVVNADAVSNECALTNI